MPKVQYYYKPVARMKKRQPYSEKSKEELANSKRIMKQEHTLRGADEEKYWQATNDVDYRT